MRFPAAAAIRTPRISAIALIAATLALAGVVLVSATPSLAAAEEFGVAPFSFQTGACNNANPKSGCTEPDTQAGSHPVFSITAFTLNTNAKGEPVVPVKRVRVDSPAGFITNPNAIPQCTEAELGTTPGKEACPLGSQMGVEVATFYNPVKAKDETAEYAVYNMVPPTGSPADFAYVTPTGVVNIVGGVSWHSEPSVKGGVPTGDSHEYYTISNIFEPAPLVSSTLVFLSKPNSTFLTVPTSCLGPATNYLEVESYAGEVKNSSFTPVPPLTPVPLETIGCEKVPFSPTFALSPETKQSDAPDGASVEIAVPQPQEPLGLASSHLRNSEVTLPEGMTLNPSAASELEGCTPAQAELATDNKIECPARSVIGSAVVKSPAILPSGAPTEKGEGELTGSIYLGKPASGPIGGPPYTLYVAVESARYGLGMRLEGSVVPNPVTGQLTTVFKENPQEPFSSLKLTFKGGALSPLANPLSCGPASASANLTSWSVGAANPLSSSPFTVDSNNAGGACASPLPFSLSQSTETQSGLAGAATSFKLTLTRPEGQQYLGQVKSVLPAGLLGSIPSVPLCGEAEANAGSCSAASQIGAAAVTAGSGPTPFAFVNGRVYLTGPYNGAPYGMSIVVPAVAGPFNLGNVVTRATINVEPYSGRLVVASTLPQVVGGIPLRLRALVISINRQSFLTNPTSCAALATESTLGGFITPGTSSGATQSLSTPFQVGECAKLAFKPSLSAVSGSKTSRANGASIEVKVTQTAKQANIRQVTMQLPKQLPSRGSTLKKACLAAAFETGPPPGACPNGASVGGASVTTPDLPGTLSGPAYLVSHGGQAFPDLDLILRGDGVTIVLVGHSHVSTNGIITSNFESLPDAPITSATVNLPVGPQSLLAANGNLCREQSKLIAPTTIVGQNGTKITQKTKISVRNCPVLIVSHRTTGVKALVTVKTPNGGRVSGGGPDLQFTTRHIKQAGQLTLGVQLSRVGTEVLQKFGRLRLRLRVGFVSKTRHYPSSKAFATVTFRT
jgi:hypothetical protein